MKIALIAISVTLSGVPNAKAFVRGIVTAVSRASTTSPAVGKSALGMKGAIGRIGNVRRTLGIGVNTVLKLSHNVGASQGWNDACTQSAQAHLHLHFS